MLGIIVGATIMLLALIGLVAAIMFGVNAKRDYPLDESNPRIRQSAVNIRTALIALGVSSLITLLITSVEVVETYQSYAGLGRRDPWNAFYEVIFMFVTTIFVIASAISTYTSITHYNRLAQDPQDPEMPAQDTTEKQTPDTPKPVGVIVITILAIVLVLFVSIRPGVFLLLALAFTVVVFVVIPLAVIKLISLVLFRKKHR